MPPPVLLPPGNCRNFFVDSVSLGVPRIILRPNAFITDDDCHRIRAELLALTRGRRGGVLLQITGVGSVTRAAVTLCCEAAAVTAFAVLGCTPVDWVIAQTLLRLAPPTCATDYFTAEDEAVIWLQNHPVALDELIRRDIMNPFVPTKTGQRPSPHNSGLASDTSDDS